MLILAHPQQTGHAPCDETVGGRRLRCFGHPGRAARAAVAEGFEA